MMYNHQDLEEALVVVVKMNYALAEATAFDDVDKPKKSAFNSFDGIGTTKNVFICKNKNIFLHFFLLVGRPGTGS